LTGWVFQLAALATNRFVDDDYCTNCANDGYTWGVDAFSTLQSALDASWFADIINVQPGIYSSAIIHAGQDDLILQGTDPDAVFLDANGGTGIEILPAGEISNSYPDIENVTIQNFTIRNADIGIELNYGGHTSSEPDVGDRRNVEIKNVLFYQDIANSTAIKALSSAVWIHDNTLVSNAPGVTLI
ncbi:MAG: hypothetical protein GY759_17870, partial [Chloroflexi bacterium]|nr:hypothetical protein [Chloroflexota bacterium]